MVNVVPEELQGQKLKWAAGPKVFVLKTSRRTTFTLLPLRLFQRIPFFIIPKLVNWILFSANVAPRDYPREYTPLAFTNIDSVTSNIVRGNYKEWKNTLMANTFLPNHLLINTLLLLFCNFTVEFWSPFFVTQLQGPGVCLLLLLSRIPGRNLTTHSTPCFHTRQTSLWLNVQTLR